MTQIEQLQVIIHKEIKQKQWMLDNKNDTKCSNAYFSGCLASLRYLKHVIDNLINENKDERATD
jgi:hypothetical protein